MKNRNLFKILVFVATILLLLANSKGYLSSNNISESSSVENTTDSQSDVDNTDTATRFYFLDVGQGDSTIVESNGEYMLIDGGEYDQVDKVRNSLKELNIEKIKYLIATHPHSDHIGSLPTIIDEFDIENIIMPNVANNTKTFEKLLTSIENKENINVIEPKVGDNYTVGDCSFTIIGPSTYTDKNYNNDSVAIKLVHQNDKFMLCGDAEKAEESDILKTGIDLNVDLYKASHHGSSTATTTKFFNAMSPEYAIISCGKNNSYGHPHKETLDLFNKYKVKVLRTDESGDIIITSTGNGLKIEKGVISGTSLSN